MHVRLIAIAQPYEFFATSFDGRSRQESYTSSAGLSTKQTTLTVVVCNLSDPHLYIYILLTSILYPIHYILPRRFQRFE